MFRAVFVSPVFDPPRCLRSRSLRLSPSADAEIPHSFDMSRHAAKWAAAKCSARQELTQIPPPLKSVYLNINQESQWQNPFLSVEQNMIQVRIYLPDENASPIDRGGITRLSSARKQVVNVRLAELPRALSSLPDGAWPYGRVVAIGKKKIRRKIAHGSPTISTSPFVPCRIWASSSTTGIIPSPFRNSTR